MVNLTGYKNWHDLARQTGLRYVWWSCGNWIVEQNAPGPHKKTAPITKKEIAELLGEY